jgi:hypothetical protein
MSPEEAIESGLSIRVRETSLSFLDGCHAPRTLTQARKPKARRVRARLPSTPEEFVCAGCGEIHSRRRNGGPAPRFCSQLCNTRTWRAENAERARAQGRAYYRKGRTT